MKIITYNIDGLSYNKILNIRTQTICNTLLKEDPDIILLQEVTNKNEPIIKSNFLDKYNYFCPPNESLTTSYYVAMLIKKEIKVLSQDVYVYPTSTMGRHLLIVKTEDHTFMTSHLESMDFNKDTRQIQLAYVKSLIKDNVIFGGDTNIENNEDPSDNTNLAITWYPTIYYGYNGEPKRYDRFYTKLPIKETIVIGKDNVYGYDFTPSDHYGLMITI